MFYQLPTRSPRKYVGKYPHRIHSFSSAKGCVHIETNAGARYVASYDSVNPFKTLIGAHLDDVVLGIPVQMTQTEYHGVLFLIELARWARRGFKKGY